MTTTSANPIGLRVDGAKFLVKDGGETKEILGLLELPALGSGERETLDTTTLKDDYKKSIFGKKDFGTLEFKFLYDNSQATSNYRILSEIEKAEVKGVPKVVTITIELPDTTTFEFDAVISVIIDANSGGDAMKFTCKALVQSDMQVNNPTA